MHVVAPRTAALSLDSGAASSIHHRRCHCRKIWFRNRAEHYFENNFDGSFTTHGAFCQRGCRWHGVPIVLLAASWRTPRNGRLKRVPRSRVPLCATNAQEEAAEVTVQNEGLTSGEVALWRRAYEVECERAKMLELVAGTLSDDAAGEQESGTPSGGWRVAFEIMRAQNQLTEDVYRKQLAAAAKVAEAEGTVLPSTASAENLGTLLPRTEPVESAEAAADAAAAGDPSTKVYSIFTLPPDEISEEISWDAFEVVTETDFPALTAFFGIGASNAEIPTLARVREALCLDDVETRAIFRLESTRSYGERVHEFRGRLVAAQGAPIMSVDAAAEQLGALLVQLQTRVQDALPVPVEIFLQPGENDDEAYLFAFLREDLPVADSQEATELLSSCLALLTVVLCNGQALTTFLSTQDVLLPGDLFDFSDSQLGPDAEFVWPLGPLLLTTLLAAAAARRLSARFYGLEISQIPLPSVTAGHLGSVWIPNSLLPNQRANFDVAAAGPIASLLISFALSSLGVWSVQSPDAYVPLRLPALQMPVLLAAALGCKVPVAGEQPLLTLAKPELPLEMNPDGLLVPVDAALSAGSFGLLVTAVNLLPLGGFDGYTMARAAFGQRTAATLEFASLAALCLEIGRDDPRGVFASEVVLIWMLQRVLGNGRDEAMPPKDSLSSAGIERQVLGAALFAVSALILMPPL